MHTQHIANTPHYSSGLNKLKKDSFWGKLLGGVLTAFAGAVGGAVGGPVGAIVAGWLSNMLSGLIYEFNAGSNEEEADEFPLTLAEEIKFKNFTETQLKPTLNSLLDTIDKEIVYQQNTLGFSANNAAIVAKANYILKSISIVKANSALVVNGTITTQDSINYTNNKDTVLITYLNGVEKAVIKYIEEENSIQYNLVEETEIISDKTIVEKITLDWGNNEVSGLVKKYVSPVEETETQTPVVIVNTDTTNNDPATPETSSTVVTTTTTQKPNKITKTVLWIAGLLSVAYILKPIKSNKK